MSIRSIASATPSVCHDAAEIARQTGADEAFIREKVGIHKRFILGPDETGLDLAEMAGRRLFETTELTADEVGALVFVTQNPDRRIPHNAPGFAERLGLPRRLASFDLSLGCSGYVYGLATIEALMQAQGIRNGLLVTCDPYSRVMAAEDKATNAVFGDAATVTWITTGEGGRTKLIGCDFGTDGSGGDAIRIEAGGATKPFVSFDDANAAHGYSRTEQSLQMDGRDVFNFVNSMMPKSFEASLAKAGLRIDEIDWFALHQGSFYMLQALARRSGIPAEKLLMNISDYGNTVSSTIPLLLEKLMKEEALDSARVMVSGFGVGLSWATGILEFNAGGFSTNA